MLQHPPRRPQKYRLKFSKFCKAWPGPLEAPGATAIFMVAASDLRVWRRMPGGFSGEPSGCPGQPPHWGLERVRAEQMAPWGQAALHLPQWIHSGLLGV